MNNDQVVVQGNDLWCRACGQREPLQLPLSVKDLSHFCQTWAQAHADCELVERWKLVGELREVANKLLAENKRMREAIAAMPDTAHYEWSREREKLRKAAGLEAAP